MKVQPTVIENPQAWLPWELLLKKSIKIPETIQVSKKNNLEFRASTCGLTYTLPIIITHYYCPLLLPILYYYLHV